MLIFQSNKIRDLKKEMAGLLAWKNRNRPKADHHLKFHFSMLQNFAVGQAKFYGWFSWRYELQHAFISVQTETTAHLSKHAFQSCMYFHNAENSWASIVPFLKTR